MSGETVDKDDESKSDEEKVNSMAEHLEMLDRVRRESEENRKFWKEELRSMNKWEKYGFGSESDQTKDRSTRRLKGNKTQLFCFEIKLNLIFSVPQTC